MSRWPSVEVAPEAILFVDDDLVAVDKASGVLCDASRDPDREHLGTALTRWADTDGSEFLPVHRLDLGTSGVVLFARNPPTATALMRQFQERLVSKHYQAIVTGSGMRAWSPGFTFDRQSYLRHHKGRSEEVRSGGKSAQTSFEVRAVDGPLALVRATPSTGRTHQLRVHLAAVGAPILGDDRYGTQEHPEARRLWLHADTLTFTHPSTDERLTISSRHRLGVRHGAPTIDVGPEKPDGAWPESGRPEVR